MTLAIITSHKVHSDHGNNNLMVKFTMTLVTTTSHKVDSEPGFEVLVWLKEGVPVDVVGAPQVVVQVEGGGADRLRQRGQGHGEDGQGSRSRAQSQQCHVGAQNLQPCARLVRVVHPFVDRWEERNILVDVQ